MLSFINNTINGSQKVPDLDYAQEVGKSAILGVPKMQIIELFLLFLLICIELKNNKKMCYTSCVWNVDDMPKLESGRCAPVQNKSCLSCKLG